MSSIPKKEMVYLEQAIYLPMLLVILEKDYSVVEKAAFKLKEPYMQLITEARVRITEDLVTTKAYLQRNKMRVVRSTVDELFTEYHFHYDQLIEVRRYSNIRLRNQCVERLKQYYSN